MEPSQAAAPRPGQHWGLHGRKHVQRVAILRVSDRNVTYAVVRSNHPAQRDTSYTLTRDRFLSTFAYLKG